jgi:hypothetical protein
MIIQLPNDRLASWLDLCVRMSRTEILTAPSQKKLRLFANHLWELRSGKIQQIQQKFPLAWDPHKFDTFWIFKIPLTISLKWPGNVRICVVATWMQTVETSCMPLQNIENVVSCGILAFRHIFKICIPTSKCSEFACKLLSFSGLVMGGSVLWQTGCKRSRQFASHSGSLRSGISQYYNSTRILRSSGNSH